MYFSSCCFMVSSAEFSTSRCLCSYASSSLYIDVFFSFGSLFLFRFYISIYLYVYILLEHIKI